METYRAPLRIDRPWQGPLRVFGVRTGAAEVILDDDGFHARFGRFRVDTPWDNVLDASVTGPLVWYRVIGPRLSLADRGVTFGSSAAGGTCVRFHRPVAALFGAKRVHPGLTVTVKDPDALRAAIAARLAARG